jgi:peptidoglycan hydrolase-like protein with peptidoglycan-binding domain
MEKNSLKEEKMGKANLQEFIDYLLSHVDKSIYVWGGQGQDLSSLTEQKIKDMETSASNAERAIKLWKERKDIPGAKAFDCSGLGMYFLQNLKGVYGDMTANGMKGKCQKLSKSQLKKGDWVFKCYASGSAYHIGYIADDALNVVEAKGRDDGVIKRALSAGGWNYYGRPEVFADGSADSAPAAAKWTLSRELKRVLPNMSGADVKSVQSALVSLGYSVGSKGIDGKYGADTESAVKSFQKAKGLTADGIVGEKTCEALGGKWTENTSSVSHSASWTLSRLLKRTIPNMSGEDVKSVQKALVSFWYSVGSKGVDGEYGNSTKNAVISFQKAKGLTADGIVGEKTCAALGGKWKG